MLRYLAVGLAIAVGANLVRQASGSKGNVVKWTGGNSILWPSSTTKAIYQKTGNYVGKNMLATRVAIVGNQAIITIPRLKHGTAMTLGKINLKSRSCPPSLKPYPCWALQEEGNCEALQNAVDLFLDSNDVLWILDTGVVNTLEYPVRRCPPKVVALNAQTQKILRSIDLSHLTSESSRLQYLVADYDPAGNPFLYITDADAHAILVQDVSTGRSHRVILPPEVANGCGERDVLYAALQRRSDGSSNLVFSYLCGERLFSVGTEHLRSGEARGRVRHLGAKSDRVVLLGTDSGSAIFFRKEGEAGIYRWDLEDCAGPEEAQLVREPGDGLLLPTHVAPDYKRERMRVLESNFPDFFKGTVGCGVEHSLSLL